MFFRKKVDLAELPLEQVRFSSEDLFCLLGGLDTCMTACDPSVFTHDLIDATHPERDEWRRNLVNRYQAAGWVDAEGNPNDELARALAPLAAMGLAIADSTSGLSKRVGITISEAGATAVVHARGIGKGWFLRPFPADRSQWPAFFRGLFSPKDCPFGKARLDYHFAWAEPEDEDLAGICSRGDEPGARAYAARHGLDAAATVELARAIGEGCERWEPFVIDLTGCEPETSAGWRNPNKASGPARFRRALVLPPVGAVFSDCNAWNPRVSSNWLENAASNRDATAFYSVDFHASGDLFEALCYAPAYPGQEDAEAAEANRHRWLA